MDGNLLAKSFSDEGKPVLMLEGFGVDHGHTKLFLMYCTSKMTEWKPIISNNDKVLEKDEGSISSHDGPRMCDEERSTFVDHIRNYLQAHFNIAIKQHIYRLNISMSRS